MNACATENNLFCIWQLPVDRPFLPAPHQICILLLFVLMCAPVCLDLMATSLFVCVMHFDVPLPSPLPHTLAYSHYQPAATIFGNFYVNRITHTHITHPTSTLKIHKYFSAVNWWERMAQRDYRHAHNEWKMLFEEEEKNTSHFNDNAIHIGAAATSAAAAASAAATLKGCKSLNFVPMKWNAL